MLFLPLGLFYKTMGLLDEVNYNNSYNNNNSYNLSTINTGCGLVPGVPEAGGGRSRRRGSGAGKGRKRIKYPKARAVCE